ncbi:MAG TPA: hypothetical protein VNO33_07605 [Kofleriaceae bacterium]|nr:hypothetical protein [Kofleriaceae bacterium]
MSGSRLARVAMLAAALAATACGGSSDRGASEPGASETGELLPDAECCCQRYNEDGDPTGAIISDESACKSTGGTCTEDKTQCESE